jgi:hypothetical protein
MQYYLIMSSFLLVASANYCMHSLEQLRLNKEKNIPNAKSGSTSLASAIAASATAACPEDSPSIDIASACCSISSSS